MNANERKWEFGEGSAAGAAGSVARRRFLGWCAVLCGAALPMVGKAAGAGAARAAGGGTSGPRELSLKEADFYRPHDLAG